MQFDHLRRHRQWISLRQFHLTQFEDSGLANKPTGLFGIDMLDCPAGWQTLYNQCLSRCEENLALLLERPVTQHDSITQIIRRLHLLDGISIEICSLMDPAELCRSVMGGTPHAHSADQYYDLMAHYVHKLNANPDIYNTLRAIYQHREFANLPPTHREFVLEMMKESEINGIHLSEQQRKQVIEHKQAISMEGAYFMRASNQPAPVSSFTVPKQALANLPQDYAGSVRVQGEQAQLPTSQFMAEGVLRHVEDPMIRKRMYISTRNTPTNDVSQHLQNMIVTRDRMAKILGYNTYSEYALSTKLIESPEKALAFLNHLSNEYREQTDQELNLLYSLKCKTELTGDPIFQWDFDYYANIIKTNAIDSLKAPSSSELSEYFMLDNVLEGLSRIVHQMFGLKLKQVPMNPGESWHPDVVKTALLSRHEGIVGYIYMDLWNRANKQSIGVNYVLELGYRDKNYNIVTTDLPNMNDYRTPKVALVCSFHSKHAGDQMRSLLDHSELEVLFHEFGHSLHTVLSRGDFQHLCGTRGPVDFVEIPSTLMENFTWDPKILRQFAHHHSSGRVLSEQMINSYKEANTNMFKGVETQKQISMAMLDLILHGKHPVTKSPQQIMSELHQNNLKIAGDIGNRFLAGFSHLYFYGSSYYCYLLSKYYADKIWKNFFVNGYKVNRERGEIYRRKFLQKGASLKPQSIINNFTRGAASSPPSSSSSSTSL
ncbi:hypothetical protein SAMD00019534_109390 [Acytostelium subglobosum LB1]|uniref:hypothetical protein n=1 Tax=Acytostelium subglobosum LB1 TaxID=1410327 RepID=UPI000644CBEB|nr:hypothetical protein SAMD00019534_109390 [Acytostelium subglobosum LB1]GAM27763.1 hypothetical protein SAMD00019534_109390 [Acytostelium subglobosum LB1]|eukprot:XP_012749422.1 hypothetical protein SAMD00019534_109390 [Acytostelium subglobosum LB1]